MKFKTRSSAEKRFKITKRGKVIFRHQGGRHLKLTKSKKRIRRQKEPAQLKGRLGKTIKKMLAYG